MSSLPPADLPSLPTELASPPRTAVFESLNPSTLDLNSRAGQNTVRRAVDDAQQYISNADIDTLRAANPVKLGRAMKVLRLGGFMTEAITLGLNVAEYGPMQGMIEQGADWINVYNQPAAIGREMLASEGVLDNEGNPMGLGVMPLAMERTAAGAMVLYNQILGLRGASTVGSRNEYDEQLQSAEDQILLDRSNQ